VDVQAEDQALISQPGHLVVEALVALGRENSAVGRSVERVGPAQREVVAEGVGNNAHAAQKGEQSRPYLRDVVTDAGLDFQLRLHELCRDVFQSFLGASGEKTYGSGTEVAGVAIEDLKFQFDADGVLGRGMEQKIFQRSMG
jgi:hypothetical protein